VKVYYINFLTLKCGIVYKHSKNTVVFMVFLYNNINNIMISLLNDYKIRNIKSLNFHDFYLAVELVNKKCIFY
jgi:hypothetical protein